MLTVITISAASLLPCACLPVAQGMTIVLSATVGSLTGSRNSATMLWPAVVIRLLLLTICHNYTGIPDATVATMATIPRGEHTGGGLDYTCVQVGVGVVQDGEGIGKANSHGSCSLSAAPYYLRVCFQAASSATLTSGIDSTWVVIFAGVHIWGVLDTTMARRSLARSCTKFCILMFSC